MNNKAFEQKKQFIIGKNVVGIDPAKNKHQLALVEPGRRNSDFITGNDGTFREKHIKQTKNFHIEKKILTFIIAGSCVVRSVDISIQL